MVRDCRLRAPSHTRISTVKQQVRSPQPLLGAPAHRHFSQTLRFALPRKDSQDKDSINTEATEYSKSGTDDASAQQEDAAFDPDITDPQHEKQKAGEGTDTNPLDVSPANPEVSNQREGTEGGAESSASSSNTESDRKRSSGGSSPSKGSKVT